jgi:hypothetical protein
MGKERAENQEEKGECLGIRCPLGVVGCKAPMFTAALARDENCSLLA